jgi:hypothetical protein
MSLFRTTRDSPRSVAAVTEFLHSKNLHVINIDDVNEGLDCFYWTVKYGLRGTVQDQFSFAIDNVRPDNAVQLRDMSVQDMRNAVARTIQYFVTSTDTAVAGIKERLDVHTSHVVLEFLGPTGLGRILGNSTIQQVETATRFCKPLRLACPVFLMQCATVEWEHDCSNCSIRARNS